MTRLSVAAFALVVVALLAARLAGLVGTDRAIHLALAIGFGLASVWLSLLGRIALHWRILAAMLLGVACGVTLAQVGAPELVRQGIAPLGALFLNLLKMIAVPLVLFSLVAGVASLEDSAKVGRIGGKTVALYLGTTAVAITIGLLVANLLQPGSGIDSTTRDALMASGQAEAGTKIAAARQSSEGVGLLGFLLGIVPSNPFRALATGEMLQIVFFALLLGVALTRLPGGAAKPVVDLFQRLSDAVIEMVHLIMRIAPIGVFALLAGVVAQFGEDAARLGDVLTALLGYMATVVIALLIHGAIVYPLLIRTLTKVPVRRFLRAITPAQLLAFSSSSSAATLPVTIDCVEKGVGVDDEASSFVLPLGATINMDGTGLYQGVAAIFIATVLQVDLTLVQQLEIVLTATLASIGTAAVPGVGIVMLIIVLRQAGIPEEGIALILGVDRPLDMCRTVVNVTGDATVCTVVAASEGLVRDEETAAT
ncbi:MAG: dicarboxylate/amino acid:cation symporter [Planctomycetes bacterium]|nr:dicarboxylate/amino acid:cation symporter [Planctomycetota bacterium]